MIDEHLSIMYNIKKKLECLFFEVVEALEITKGAEAKPQPAVVHTHYYIHIIHVHSMC